MVKPGRMLPDVGVDVRSGVATERYIMGVVGDVKRWVRNHEMKIINRA